MQTTLALRERSRELRKACAERRKARDRKVYAVLSFSSSAYSSSYSAPPNPKASIDLRETEKEFCSVVLRETEKEFCSAVLEAEGTFQYGFPESALDMLLLLLEDREVV